MLSERMEDNYKTIKFFMYVCSAYCMHLLARYTKRSLRHTKMPINGVKSLCIKFISLIPFTAFSLLTFIFVAVILHSSIGS